MEKDFKNKVILNSLGLLDKVETEEFKNEISPSSEEDKKLVSEMNNLVSLLPKALNQPIDNISPSDKVKERLLSKIASAENTKTDTEEEKFNFIFSESGDWFPHPTIDGINIKPLSYNEDKGYAMLLLKVAAGTIYPSHHHSGAEECYVLEGDLYAEGKVLGPGDFHHAEGGSDHDPLYTKNGCTVILVMDPKDY